MTPEIDRIKDRLRKCTTPEQVEEIADQERQAVHAIAIDHKDQAIQIANLKAYMLAGMETEE